MKLMTMPNPASQWRVAIAQNLAAVYGQNPHVAAVVLSGSTARGHADRYSDIELAVFWHQSPTDDERLEAASQSKTDVHRLYPYDDAYECWSDDLMAGRNAANEPSTGVLIEVVHSTTEFLERVLNSVLIQYDPNEDKQNLVAAILHGIALHHAPLVQTWQARAKTYPVELGIAVIRRHGVIDHFWRWQMWLDRGPNLMMLHQQCVQVQQKLLHMLLGLNHVYYFGFKWLEVIVASLPIAPTNLVARLNQVYEVAPAEGAHKLAELVDEVYDLIELHQPEIDVAWLRRVFHYQRPIWDAAPASNPATE